MQEHGTEGGEIFFPSFLAAIGKNNYYCGTGKIEGAYLVGKTWNVPAEAQLPRRKKAVHQSPLLTALREQKEAKMKGGIYHRVQIDLTYNSNHIEGSRLTHDQTRYIFETNTIGSTDDLKMFYYRGLHHWPSVKGYLMDTYLAAQDEFKLLLEKFRIEG